MPVLHGLSVAWRHAGRVSVRPRRAARRTDVRCRRRGPQMLVGLTASADRSRADSDAVLRQLLTWDRIHVRRGPAGPGGGAMIALLRYQTANLFRSHRWIFPLITYALLISVGGGAAGPGGHCADRRTGLERGHPGAGRGAADQVDADCRAAAARACVSAARGPGRAQLAALMTAFAAGAVLGLAGAGYELVTSWRTRPQLLGPARCRAWARRWSAPWLGRRSGRCSTRR